MRRVSIARSLGAIALVMALHGIVGAQPAKPIAPPALAQPPAAPSEIAPTVPLDVLLFEHDEGDRMTVPVSFDGRGPYRFLVDTGAERTVISQELARKLDLAPGKSVMVHSMTEVAQVATALIPSLEISKRTMTDVHAPAYSASNLGAAGMLGVDSLQAQRVMFDFGKKTMTIVPSRRRAQNWGPDTIVITGRSLFGRLVLVDASIDGEKIVVVLDTGSQISVGNSALRRQLAAKKRLRPTVPVELTSVSGGRMMADYTAVRKIKLGGMAVENMPIAFADVHPFRQLKLLDQPAFLLGMDVLQLFDRVSVDFARKEVSFLPVDPSARAGSGRMARAQEPPPALAPRQVRAGI